MMLSMLTDCRKLQQKLAPIENWCPINKLNLNPSKCNVTTYTVKANTVTFNYIIDSKIFSWSDTYKDLRVILTHYCHLHHISIR